MPKAKKRRGKAGGRFADTAAAAGSGGALKTFRELVRDEAKRTKQKTAEAISRDWEGTSGGSAPARAAPAAGGGTKKEKRAAKREALLRRVSVAREADDRNRETLVTMGTLAAQLPSLEELEDEARRGGNARQQQQQQQQRGGRGRGQKKADQRAAQAQMFAAALSSAAFQANPIAEIRSAVAEQQDGVRE